MQHSMWFSPIFASGAHSRSTSDFFIITQHASETRNTLVDSVTNEYA
jgi:hypothetical protein